MMSICLIVAAVIMMLVHRSVPEPAVEPLHTT